MRAGLEGILVPDKLLEAGLHHEVCNMCLLLQQQAC